MQVDIVRMENLRALKMKIRRIEEMIDDAGKREDEIINLLEETLIKHGKDASLIERIAQVSTFLGEKIGKSEAFCQKLSKAARIYDIGNIVIESEIYEKDDELSYEEFQVVKNHTIVGYNILVSLGFSSTDLAAVISAEHHEWWNGGGYPHQLKFERIHIASRIVTVAENVCVLQTPRPGRKVWDFKKVLEYIETRKGVEFDPLIAQAVLDHAEAIGRISRYEPKSHPLDDRFQATIRF